MKSNKKLFLLVATSFALAACGGNSNPTSGASTPASTPTSTPEGETSQKGTEPDLSYESLESSEAVEKANKAAEALGKAVKATVKGKQLGIEAELDANVDAGFVAVKVEKLKAHAAVKASDGQGEEKDIIKLANLEANAGLFVDSLKVTAAGVDESGQAVSQEIANLQNQSVEAYVKDEVAYLDASNLDVDKIAALVKMDSENLAKLNEMLEITGKKVKLPAAPYKDAVEGLNFAFDYAAKVIAPVEENLTTITGVITGLISSGIAQVAESEGGVYGLKVPFTYSNIYMIGSIISAMTGGQDMDPESVAKVLPNLDANSALTITFTENALKGISLKFKSDLATISSRDDGTTVEETVTPVGSADIEARVSFRNEVSVVLPSDVERYYDLSQLIPAPNQSTDTTGAEGGAEGGEIVEESEA